MRKTIAFILLFMMCGMTYAHDFMVKLNGQSVYFTITSKRNKTAEVTYRGSIADKHPIDYAGELTIPAYVKYDNVIYSVVGVSPKAFSGADKLTGVIFPTGVTSIGDFAFEGCTSLSKIIFPGNEMTFGKGVFFKCDKIQYLSLGSDWKEINFENFRWSDSLKTVSIPAKIKEIRNLRYLKNLESITVDINNSTYTSVDGVLYSKNLETLDKCPRAYKGVLRVAKETRVITRGALINSKGITQVILSDSLNYLFFREFSRMENLEEIVFKSKTPIMTAQSNDTTQLFLLQVANPSVKVIVPKDGVNNYKKALVQKEGEYSRINGTRYFDVTKEQLIGKKNIVGVKNFAKYEDE